MMPAAIAATQKISVRCQRSIAVSDDNPSTEITRLSSGCSIATSGSAKIPKNGITAPRLTTSVMALTPAVVLQFKKSDIEPLIEQHPRVMYDFMRAIIKRIHHTANEIGRQQMALSDYISTGGKGRI